AAGVFAIVNQAMADRIRVVLADSGYDAREFTLLCFGGAGGIHAPALVGELGIRRVLIPYEASTLSALGLLPSDVRYDFVQTVVRPLHATSGEDVRAAFARMRGDAERRLARASGIVADAPARYEQLADMRYVGQTHELRIPLPAQIDDVAEVGAA